MECPGAVDEVETPGSMSEVRNQECGERHAGQDTMDGVQNLRDSSLRENATGEIENLDTSGEASNSISRNFQEDTDDVGEVENDLYTGEERNPVSKDISEDPDPPDELYMSGSTDGKEAEDSEINPDEMSMDDAFDWLERKNIPYDDLKNLTEMVKLIKHEIAKQEAANQTLASNAEAEIALSKVSSYLLT